MRFPQLGLPAPLLNNVSALGYEEATPIQAQAIPACRSGRDLVATAQTGTGKTAAFLLPVLEKLLARPRGGAGTLVLTPTRELAQQIIDVFAGLAQGTGLRAALVIGGQAMQPQVRAARSADLIVATPGRLLAHLNDGAFKLATAGILVLDEADQMFDLGFFPDVKRIISHLPARRQNLLFSATMPPEVEQLARGILRDPARVSIGKQGTAVQAVAQVAYPVPMSRKKALLCELLERMEEPSVLVFTRTRRGAKKLTRALHEDGHEVAELHADRSATQREKAMRTFREGKVPILVATNIAARGIDVRHITHVVNYDVPMTPEEFVHRIGRAGRAGDEGDALVFYSPEEADLLARIERRLGKPLPRRRVEGFDYTPDKPKPMPARKPGKRPFAMAGGPKPFGKPKRKPSR
ncbi:MAG: DEAD/DEAH box helicase [Gemmataceae bacterium]|nr:DEAD/DEAH box helicase [Gemmataceae bacterium]